MPDFKDIESGFTEKTNLSGNEEIQVSESQKAKLAKVASLALGQKVTGWSKMPESQYSDISASDSLLTVLQKIALLSGNGEGAIFQARSTNNSFVGIAFEYLNGSVQSIQGVFVDTLTATIGYFANGSGTGTTTLPAFIKLSDADKISFIKSNGYKGVNLDSNLNAPGFSTLPISSQLKFADSRGSIRGLLQMLTASVCQGRLRIVVGNPSTGASGKPEIAFIVNNVQGVNAEIQGTNGLQIFHFTTNFIRVIPSSDIALAWPALQTASDEALIKKLTSTASGDWGNLGIKLPWSGGSGTKHVTVTNFQTNVFTGTAFKDLAVGEIFTFESAVSATNGPGVALWGIAVKQTSFICLYYGWDTHIILDGSPTMYSFQSASLYSTKWNKIGESATKLGSAYPISDYSAQNIIDIASILEVGGMCTWYSSENGAPLPGEPVRCALGGTIQRVYQQTSGNESAVVITAFGADQTTGQQYSYIRTVSEGGLDSGWSSLGGGGGENLVKLWEGETLLTNGAPEMFNFTQSINAGDKLMIVYNYSGFIGDGGILTGNEYGRTFIYKYTLQTELAQSFYTIKQLGQNLQYGLFTLKISDQGSMAISMEGIGDEDAVINPFTVTEIYKLP